MSRFTRNRNAGLLLIRVAAGIVFFAHGWMKINNISGVEGMFVHFGLGGGVGIFIAWFETIGGLALILGVLTRIFATGFGIEMLVAVFIAGVPSSYAPHELEIFLMLVSFGIALAGSGAYSLWKMECDFCGGMLCRADADCPAK